MKLMPAALALAAALTSVSAQATGWTHTKSCWPDCTTTLTFSSLLDLSSKYVYKDTDAGGDATVTPTGGSPEDLVAILEAKRKLGAELARIAKLKYD